MRSLRVGTDFYVNASEVLFVMPFKTRVAARQRHIAKGKNLFVDATDGGTSRSIIVMRDGQVVSSPSTPETLVSRALINPPCRASTRDSHADEPSAAMQAAIDEINDIDGRE